MRSCLFICPGPPGSERRPRSKFFFRRKRRQVGGDEARSFRGTWLPDSSGYTVTESDPEADSRVRVRYDVATGKRTVMETAQGGEQNRRRRFGRNNTSPDGRLVLTYAGRVHTSIGECRGITVQRHRHPVSFAVFYPEMRHSQLVVKYECIFLDFVWTNADRSLVNMPCRNQSCS